MPTNSQIEVTLKAELTKFLELFGFITYDEGFPGERWCMLMSTRLKEDTFRFLVILMVQEWMENGITKITQWATLKRMKMWEVVFMVKEDIEKGLVAIVEIAEGL
ncbi:hypothetical protein BGX38DRAFT_1146425 [Terfezia claveryi]|nr:hypothetical protein BGX38DRAFT_1146425 [Terfezia claveryi]